jgi:signal transduction histidine kinase/CheY-like chemotaxis protein
MTKKLIKILLVEDNPGDVLLLQESLAESLDPKFEIHPVEFLAQALEAMEKDRFDAVLLDLSLPDSQGLETFSRIYTPHPEIPVVVLTGFADETMAVKAVRNGAQDYLVKGQTDRPLLVRAIRYSIQRLAAEEELRRVNRALKVSSECNQALVHATEETELLQNICRNIVEIGGYRLAWVGYAESDEYKSVRPVAQAGFEEGYLEAAKISWADTLRGRGPTGRAIRTGKYQIAQNFHTDPDLAPWRDQAIKRGFASSIAIPLAFHGQVFGALTVYAPETNAFSQEEIKLLIEMGDDLAYGIMSLRTRKAHLEAENRIVSTNALLELFTQKCTRKEYLDAVVDLIKNWTGCRCIGIRLIGKEATLSYESFVGFSQDFWEKENSLSLRHDQCICSRVIKMEPDSQGPSVTTPNGSFRCNNTQKFIEAISPTDQKRYRGECIRQGFLSLGVIPLRYRDEILGLIHLADPEEGKISDTRIHFIESMVPVIGEAVYRFNLEQEILDVARREQHRIGRDLHDGLGQNLTGLAFLAKVLERKLKEKNLSEVRDATQIGTLINQSINQTRALAHGLCPVELKADGLMNALQEFTVNVQSLFGIACRFKCDQPIFIQDNVMATHLYYIVQEAVNNAVKHGKACDILIHLTEENGKNCLYIKDDGIGLPEKMEKFSGMGLRTMSYRARMIGGSFEARGEAGGGTLVKCWFEIPKNEVSNGN